MSELFTQGNGRGQIPVRQACTVLYDELPKLNATVTRDALRRVVGDCSVEWARLGPKGTNPTSGLGSSASFPVMGGTADFGEHKVAMVALPAPVRREVLDVTVGVSPMPQEERDALMGHGAAIRLLYIGEGTDPVEQLSALYSVAGVLLAQNGLGIINERAALAQPAELAFGYLPQLWSNVPPVSLWTGVVTFAMAAGESGAPGRFLVRTYGMDQCALPELAISIGDRTEADDAYHVLMNTCLHLVQRRPGLQIDPGDRFEFKGRTFLVGESGRPGPEFASETGLLMLVEV